MVTKEIAMKAKRFEHKTEKNAVTTTTMPSKNFITARSGAAMLQVPYDGNLSDPVAVHRVALKAMLDYKNRPAEAGDLDRWFVSLLPQGGFVWTQVPRCFQDTRPQVCSNNFNWAGPPAEPKQAYILQTPVDPFNPDRGMQKQETYDPRAILVRQYSFASVNEETPCEGETTTRWCIKPTSGSPIYAYSWPKQEGETCDN